MKRYVIRPMRRVLIVKKVKRKKPSPPESVVKASVEPAATPQPVNRDSDNTVVEGSDVPKEKRSEALSAIPDSYHNFIQSLPNLLQALPDLLQEIPRSQLSQPESESEVSPISKNSEKIDEESESEVSPISKNSKKKDKRNPAKEKVDRDEKTIEQKPKSELSKENRDGGAEQPSSIEIRRPNSGKIEEKPDESEIIKEWRLLENYHKRWGRFPWDGGARPVPTTPRFGLSSWRVSELTKQESHIPTTLSLETILRSNAERLGFSMKRYEMMLKHPEVVLTALQKRASGEIWAEPFFDHCSTGELLDRLLDQEVITWHHHNTAEMIREIVAPDAPGSTALCEKKVVIQKILTANQNSIKESRHYYLQIAGETHEFTLEVFGSECRIYQSVPGITSLSTDMDRETRFDLESFISLFKQANRQNPKQGKPSRNVTTVRKILFNNSRYIPENKFHVSEFLQKPGVEDRLERKRTSLADLWRTTLKTNAIEQVS